MIDGNLLSETSKELQIWHDMNVYEAKASYEKFEHRELTGAV